VLTEKIRSVQACSKSNFNKFVYFIIKIRFVYTVNINVLPEFPVAFPVFTFLKASMILAHLTRTQIQSIYLNIKLINCQSIYLNIN